MDIHKHAWSEDEKYPQGPAVIAALDKGGVLVGHRTCGCGAAQTLVVKRSPGGEDAAVWRPDEMLHNYL